MPIIDTRTGKVLVTDKELIKKAKKWLTSFTKEELEKMIKEEKLTNEEKGIIGIVRLNKALPLKEIKKSFQINKLRITFNWRSKDNLWGRFGGGWNWEFGFQIGCNIIILNLLIFSLSFSLKK